MNQADIGSVLKKYRKQKSWTVPDVAILLKKNYDLRVAEKTIYGWESNQAHPTSDMFLVLCELYGIRDILTAFGKEPSGSFPLSSEEQKVIESYRNQNDSIQSAVCRVLGVPPEHNSKSKNRA